MNDQTALVPDIHTSEAHRISIPPSDVERCVSFSLFHSLVSIFTLFLVLTDIPRTGLAMRLKTFFPSPRPGVVLYHGPLDYPVVHVVREDEGLNGSIGQFYGTIGDTPISRLSIRPHKFEMASVPWRAIAKHLHVETVPSCLLYQALCSSQYLRLETVFTMLDDVYSKFQTYYFASKDRTKHAMPVLFHTMAKWTDRLHHILGSFWWHREDKKLHIIHFFKPSIDSNRISVCDPSQRHISRPLICREPLAWLLQHPSNQSKAQMRIVQHIELRFATLQSKYPSLELDLLVQTTRHGSVSAKGIVIPTVQYITDELEVVTFIRGQRCLQPQSNCHTIFLDEYRYERGTLKGNAGEWASCLAALRGIAHLYVWLRVSLLWWGCFQAHTQDPKYRDSSLKKRCLVASSTFFKIPSHVAIYSSWFPICCYALAHAIDSGVVHMVSNTTLAGSVNFQFLSYVLVASIQMRNVWILAFFWKIGLLIHSRFMGGRAQQREPTDGVLGIRGIFISLTSWLTIFSFLRAERFRDARVLSFCDLPRTTPFHDERLAPTYMNIAEFGWFLDMKTLFISSITVAIGGFIVTIAVRLVTQQPTYIIFCRSYYVPWSVGVLCPTSMLSIFWYLPLVSFRDEGPLLSWRQLSLFIGLGSKTNLSTSCVVCNVHTSALHWRRTQGCTRHDAIFHINRRSKKFWSATRLVNIGLLSDP